jgi:hypothetical protein
MKIAIVPAGHQESPPHRAPVWASEFVRDSKLLVLFAELANLL